MFRRSRSGSKRLAGDKSKKKKRSFLRRHQANEIMTPNHADEHSCEQDSKKSKKDDIYRGRYKSIAHLGKGSYGSVTECKCLQEKGSIKKGDRVAVKNVTRIFQNEVEAKRLLRELHILRTLQGHECIVNLLDIIPPVQGKSFKTLALVFVCADTDLKKILRSSQQFTSLHVEYIMYQILNGTLYMHSAGIAHRDLKPANILINADCTIRICDFGLARGINEEIDAYLGKEKPNLEVEQKAEPVEDRKASRKNAFKKRGGMRREVTKHVVTRWYRSPEVILIQQKKANLRCIDLWSIGCIFAELLQMEATFCDSYHDRSVLFPGRSCFPLSADDPFAYKDRRDQLNLIFDLIGTPTDDEIDKFKAGKPRKYLRGLKTKKAQPLASKFPSLPSNSKELKSLLESEPRVGDALDLLGQLLKFDVDKRLTAQQALDHPYLNRVRAEELESELEPVKFEFEDDKELTKFKIRQLICDEVQKLNADWTNDTRN